MNSFFKFKSSCILCGDATNELVSLCKLCQGDLPRIKSACEQCGLPTAVSANGLCGQCLQSPPVVDYTQSLFYYESPIDYLVTQLKFEEKLSCASVLGYLLAQSVQDNDDLPEVIVPVPLHKKRLFKRGFNQSLEIARPVSKQLKLPIDTDLVYKTKSTLEQAKLNVSERKKNIQGCFESQREQAYKHVVLIDDVVTTGSTINELASTLKKSGVEKVGVWSVARAILS